jgi:hypothetical protein
LRGRWYAVEEAEWRPEISPTASIKAPTASSSRGLGTGEWDAGLGLEMSKTVQGPHTVYLDLRYAFIGQPEGTDLRNQWSISPGYGYRINEDWSASAYYEERRALVSGEDNPREFFFSTDYRLKDRWNLSAGLLFGASDGAPDYGIQLGARYRFDWI